MRIYLIYSPLQKGLDYVTRRLRGENTHLVVSRLVVEYAVKHPSVLLQTF